MRWKMSKVFIKPKEGLIVRDPQNNNEPLPKEGKLITRSTYWLRRIKEGSVEIVNQVKKSTKFKGEK